MRRRSERRNSAGLPPQLLRSAPRSVGLNNAGIATLIAIAALAVGGCLAAITLYGRAVASERHVALFASEAVPVGAEVVRVQRRGGGDDRRSVVHYRYLAGDRQWTGSATVRRQERDRYAVGSQVDVRYLASATGLSWMEGYGPRREPFWPVALVLGACSLAVFGVARLMFRQADLLANGRLAQATVTKVTKKQGEHGTVWSVTYQWRLLSGAIRTAGYDHATKQPPAVGALIPLLYDREQPRRQRIYPFGLVKLKLDG